MPTRAQRAVVLLMGVACASSLPAPTTIGTREGVYIAGPEANTFRECESSLQWTVEFAQGAQPNNWPVGSRGGYNASYYFVRWQADLIVPPRVPLGQSPTVPPRVRVHAIRGVRALHQGECGEHF